MYGPLACGGNLTPGLREVANKTLPCGTRVQFRVRIRGRALTLTVPVRDRGPYCCGRSWDLSVATAEALGLGGNWSGAIGARVVPTRRSP